MFAKRTLRAVVLSIVALSALPAAASATWKHHQQPIQQDVQLGLTGKLRFEAVIGAFECQVTSRIKLLAGQTQATMETLATHPTSDTANCLGIGGFAFCQVHSLAFGGPGSTIQLGSFTTLEGIQHGNGQHTSVGTGIVHQGLSMGVGIADDVTGVFCFIQHISAGGSVLAVPNQPSTMSSFQLHGAGGSTVTLASNGQTNTYSLTVKGSLEIEAPNQNTYSI